MDCEQSMVTQAVKVSRQRLAQLRAPQRQQQRLGAGAMGSLLDGLRSQINKIRAAIPNARGGRDGSNEARISTDPGRVP